MAGSRLRQAGDPMRVISGTARGHKLVAPQGERVRPATDRLKEALFNILFDVTGDSVLDLFAGSGSLAIEALSRGAQHATLVDDYAPAVEAIDRNLAACKFEGAADTVRSEVVEFLNGRARALAAARWNLIFIDPPYELGADALGAIASALGELDSDGRLGADTRIAFERRAGDPEPPLPPGFAFRLHRAYGQTILYLAERIAERDSAASVPVIDTPEDDTQEGDSS